MSSKVKVEVINSPISPVRIPEGSIIYANKAVYYVKLSNGLVASGPADFTNDKHEFVEVEIEEQEKQE